MRMVGSEKFKYVKFFRAAGRDEFYDLQADPYQQRNLAKDPASAPLREELESTLSAWMKGTGDAWTFNSRHPVDDKGRLYRFGTFTSVDEYLQWAEAHPDLAPRD
jgi:arylsulfatase A-like enzyme